MQVQDTNTILWLSDYYLHRYLPASMTIVVCLFTLDDIDDDCDDDDEWVID